MNLHTLLLQPDKKTAILEDWLGRILETYPPETAKFLRSKKNPFANPVGSTLKRDIEKIYDELLGDMDVQRLVSFLDRIVRIRAVQDFTAARAVGFVFLLKPAVRKFVDPDIRSGSVAAEDLRAVESRIDDLSLMAFDIYMGCREKIYALRASELERRMHRLLQRARLICADPEDESKPQEGSSESLM